MKTPLQSVFPRILRKLLPLVLILVWLLGAGIGGPYFGKITKLLNRLEKGGHIVREVHPFDRRAFAIEVTPSTRTSAMQTVGKQHAKRFQSAARLTPEEREVVIRFFEDMTQELLLEGVDWFESSSH